MKYTHELFVEPVRAQLARLTPFGTEIDVGPCVDGWRVSYRPHGSTGHEDARAPTIEEAVNTLVRIARKRSGYADIEAHRVEVTSEWATADAGASTTATDHRQASGPRWITTSALTADVALRGTMTDCAVPREVLSAFIRIAYRDPSVHGMHKHTMEAFAEMARSIAAIAVDSSAESIAAYHEHIASAQRHEQAARAYETVIAECDALLATLEASEATT